MTTVSAEQLRAAMGGDGAGTGPTAYMCLLQRVDAESAPLSVEVPHTLQELVAAAQNDTAAAAATTTAAATPRRVQ